MREKYGEAARRVIEGKGLPADCCSQNSCCDGSAAASCDPITSNLYDGAQAGQIPQEALKASLGCGNPAALAELNAGETVGCIFMSAFIRANKPARCCAPGCCD